METDIAAARETLDNASAGIDKMRQELKSLVNKVAKSEVRYTRISVHKTTPELTEMTTMTGGARRGGAPAAGRACDADAIRHGAARAGRGHQGEEASCFRRGGRDQEARTRDAGAREGEGGPRHRCDEPREAVRVD